MIQPTGAQVNLYADEPETMARFYRALGFDERFRFPADGAARMVEVACGGLTLGLVSRKDMRDLAGLPTPEAPGRAEVVLWCEDLDGSVDQAVAAGAARVSGPIDFDRRVRMAWVADPEGNPVKFVCPLSGD